MGKRGPKPKPTATQKRLGTYRPDRRPAEVQPDLAVPPIPTWLGRKARRYWRQIAPLLESNGLLTALDGIALGLVCEALAELLDARAVVEQAVKDGGTKYVALTIQGNAIQHPAQGVANRAWDKLVKLLREFGMTPSARAGLAIAGKPPKDAMTELLEKIANRRQAALN